MHILVTGGTGLIGRALIPALLLQKHTVTVVSRSPKNVFALFGEAANQGQVQALTLAELKSVEQFSAIINLAGEPIADKRWTTKQKTRITQSRLDITQKLVTLLAAAKTKPHVFISGSAIGYYGRQNSDSITEAFTDIHKEFSSTLCAQWEQLALSASTPDTRVCVVRTGVVLSRDGGALSKMYLPFKLGLGGPVSKGDQGFSWIHIKDMVAGLIFLLNNKDASGAYNFTAPNPVTNKVFSQTLAKTLHRPCIFTVPKISMRLLLGEGADLLLFGQFVIPDRLENAGFTFHYPHVDQALAAIYS